MTTTAETTTRPTLNPTIHLPFELVKLEHDLHDEYLSADLPRICDAASKSGSTILISSAGLVLESREKAWSVFRRALVDQIRSQCEPFAKLMGTDAATAAKVMDGTLPLRVVDAMLEDIRRGEMEVASHLRTSKKFALVNALHLHIEGQAAGSMKIPTMLVVRGDGAMKLFPNRSLAQDWGRAGNLGYHLIPLKTEARSLFLPE